MVHRGPWLSGDGNSSATAEAQNCLVTVVYFVSYPSDCDISTFSLFASGYA